MINAKKFYLIDPEGYDDWEIAEYNKQLCYGMIPGVKVYWDSEDGKCYIVQRRRKRRRY